MKRLELLKIYAINNKRIYNQTREWFGVVMLDTLFDFIFLFVCILIILWKIK